MCADTLTKETKCSSKAWYRESLIYYEYGILPKTMEVWFTMLKPIDIYKKYGTIVDYS